MVDPPGAQPPAGLYHAYVTRFAVRLGPGSPLPNDAWLEDRFALFERYCLPSLHAQSVQGFEWLLLYDAGLDPRWAARLQGYADRWPAVVPVAIESAWDPGVAREAVARRLPAGARTLLTSRLDSDDAVAADYTARLWAAAVETGPGAVVFDWGFNLSGDALYWQPLLRGPFASVVSDCGQGRTFATVWDAEHERIDDGLPSTHLGRPSAWVQVVHGGNLANRVRGVRVPRGLLRPRFGALAEARAGREPATALALGMASSGSRFAWSIVADPARARRSWRFVSSRVLPRGRR